MSQVVQSQGQEETYIQRTQRLLQQLIEQNETTAQTDVRERLIYILGILCSLPDIYYVNDEPIFVYSRDGGHRPVGGYIPRVVNGLSDAEVREWLNRAIELANVARRMTPREIETRLPSRLAALLCNIGGYRRHLLLLDDAAEYYERIICSN